MVKVPYEKACAEVVQYDNSDVIQTASTACRVTANRFCSGFAKVVLSGDGDGPVIGN